VRIRLRNIKALCHKWQELKPKARLLWCLGLRGFDPALGFGPTAFWNPRVARWKTYYAAQLVNQNKQNMQQVEALLCRLDPLLSKLTRLAVVSDHRDSRNIMRLVLDMEPNLIREAFMWGNDDSMIRYVSERVGHMVYRELKTANLTRLSEMPQHSMFHTRGTYRPEDIRFERP
jgi:hypothetical protein